LGEDQFRLGFQVLVRTNLFLDEEPVALGYPRTHSVLWLLARSVLLGCTGFRAQDAFRHDAGKTVIWWWEVMWKLTLIQTKMLVPARVTVGGE
jgi:hypothetical protein